MWNVITSDKYMLLSSYRLRSILLPILFEVCIDAGPVDALEMQSSSSNTKVTRVQVHSLSEGLTMGLGVRLTCQLIHFCFKNIKTVAHFNSNVNKQPILLWQFVLKEDCLSRIM